MPVAKYLMCGLGLSLWMSVAAPDDAAAQAARQSRADVRYGF